MGAPFVTLLASSFLFPSFQSQETGIEGFGVDTTATGVNPPFVFTDLDGGFGLFQRSIVVPPPGKGPGFGTTNRLRLRVDENTAGDKKVFFEDVLASPGFAYVLARPDFGTRFEFGVGPFQNEVGLYGKDTGALAFRVYVPMTFNPVGFANTDQDTDKRVKYVFRIGGGGGGEINVGLGPLIVGVRSQIDIRYTYRGGAESISHNRNDTEWVLDAGVGFKMGDDKAILATFLFQQWWQATPDVLDEARSSQLIGGRLSFKIWQKFDTNHPPEPEPEPTPTEPPEPLGKPTSPA